ncbi:6-phosphofructo-2-kinase/fructose-2,6-bisphosphatase 4-like [Bombus affinis]|uniref:6-phosphofructo-2-kinase/fructose-2, 6-bisphosphatase 4-like n=1 Tax=Bombus affinis TaxID=309941 RepID=UPI0021B71AD1|nr:6-phosphofructo-2-kinase/fructose-2,6-bisphosphatase 4-like [Bombus affinis]
MLSTLLKLMFKISHYSLTLHKLGFNALRTSMYEPFHDLGKSLYTLEFAWRDQDKLRYRYPWGESYIDAMHRVEPVIAELQRSNNILVVSHQAILRCIIGVFTDKKPEEVPYAEVPLHTVIRISSQGYNYKVDFFKLPIECVNTIRVKPNNCSADRTADDALLTVPAHFDIPDPWRNLGSGPTPVQQH